MKFRTVVLYLFITGLIVIVSLKAFAQAICPLPQNIKSKGVASLESFKKIAIYDQGRIKPLDTYARNLMIQFSGKDSFNQKSAIEWLAKLLFAPGNTREDQVFIINNSEVLTKLGIPTETNNQYSFSQIEPVLQKLTSLAQSANGIEENNRNIIGEGIIRLYQNIILYTNLANSFVFAIPNADFQVNDDGIVQLLDLSQGKSLYSFLDIASKSEAIMSATDNVDQKVIEERTPQEEELLRLLGNLFRWSMSYENSSVAIIPAFDSQDKFWNSPWEVINREFKNPEIEKEIDFLRNLVVHYWNGEQLQFDMGVRLFQNSLMNRIDSSEVKTVRGLNFEVEIINNELKPLLWAKLLYGAVFFISILAILFKKSFLKYASLGLMIVGFIFHTWAVISLTLIMSRSPLENFHELFLLLSLTSILLGFILIIWNKKAHAVVISSACGLSLLIIASRFPEIY